MKFRPVCFDYHTEATNLLLETRHAKSSEKIWIRESSADDYLELDDSDRDDSQEERESMQGDSRPFDYGDAESSVTITSRRQESMYDFHWLVEFLSRVRRQALVRRIHNLPCRQPCCIYVSGMTNPIDCIMPKTEAYSWSPAFLGLPSALLENVFKHQEAMKAPLLPRSLTEGSKHDEQSQHTPYHQAKILGLSQGTNGSFGLISPGSRTSRAETRKRELKAIIPYQGAQENNERQKKAWQAAIMVAFCVLRRQAAGSNLKDTGAQDPSNPKLISTEKERRSAILVERPMETEMTKRATCDSYFQKQDVVIPSNAIVLEECEDNIILETSQGNQSRKKSKRHSIEGLLQNDRFRKYPKTLHLHSDIDPDSFSEDQMQKEKVRAKEASLLERFGLNKKGKSKHLSQTRGRSSDCHGTEGVLVSKKSHPELLGPPLRCGSPSSLDHTLKRNQSHSKEEKFSEQEVTSDSYVLAVAKVAPYEASQYPLGRRDKDANRPLRRVRKRARKQTKKSRKKERKARKRRKQEQREGTPVPKTRHKKEVTTCRTTPTTDRTNASGNYVKKDSQPNPHGGQDLMSNGCRIIPQSQVESIRDEIVQHTNGSHTPQSTALHLLCSEAFIETWGEVVAQLASRDWAVIGDNIRRTRRICFLDTSLVDARGVDIEIPYRGGIIVSTLSLWRKTGVSLLLKRLVELASTCRYRHLEFFVCVDIEITDDITEDITKLQNAVLRHKGNPPTPIHFKMTSPRSLPQSIARSLSGYFSSTLNFNQVEGLISNDNIYERILLLLSLTPTLTAGGALQCLAVAGSLQDGENTLWFQELLGKDDTKRKQIEQAARSNCAGTEEISFGSMPQLAFALDVELGKRQDCV